MKEKILFLRLFTLGVGDNEFLIALGDFYADSDKITDLQNLIASNLRPELDWMTAASIIDAMEFCYKDAVSNGNIKK